MNPAEHPTRTTIGGREFEYQKTVYRRGELKHHIFQGKDGTRAFLHTIPKSEPEPTGIIYKQPFLTILSIIMFFVRR